MKVSDDQYRACAAAGMGTLETARHLGVNAGIVSKAAKRLGISFVDKRATVASEHMRKLHADQKLNPLARLTPEQRADYDVLKKAGYSRAEAFKAIWVTA